MADKGKKKLELMFDPDGKPEVLVYLNNIQHIYRVVWTDDPILLQERLRDLFIWIVNVCSEGTEPFISNMGETIPITCPTSVTPPYLVIIFAGQYKREPVDMSFLMERCSLYVKAYAQMEFLLTDQGEPVNKIAFADPTNWTAIKGSGICFSQDPKKKKYSYFSESYVKKNPSEVKSWTPQLGLHALGSGLTCFHKNTGKTKLEHMNSYHCILFNIVEPTRIQSLFWTLEQAIESGKNIKLDAKQMEQVKNWSWVSGLILSGKNNEFGQLRILKSPVQSGEGSRR